MAPCTDKVLPSTETVKCGACTFAMMAVLVSELELTTVSEELDFGSSVCEELDSATPELDVGAEVPVPVTVIVPLLDAFLEAPVVVTVNL